MDTVQNERPNQSYYDPAMNLCSAEPSAVSSPTAAFAQLPGPRSEAEFVPPGAKILVESYSNTGSGGAPARAETDGAKGTSSAPENGRSEGRSLCERRLEANRVICGIGGGLIGGRLDFGELEDAGVGYLIGEACVKLGDWLEHNAPMGACGDD